MTVFRRKCCVGCGAEKVVSRRNFYRCKYGADGYRSKCIDCVRRDVYENRALKADYYRAYYRRRNQEAARRAATAAWKKTPAGRESSRLSNRIYETFKALEARA